MNFHAASRYTTLLKKRGLKCVSMTLRAIYVGSLRASKWGGCCRVVIVRLEI